MNTLRYICLHHSGPVGSDPYSSSQGLMLSQINTAHAARDFPESTLGYFVGYNFVIEPNGLVIQCRALGEETAAQKGHNYDTVSICILGNFTVKQNGLPVDTMTQYQRMAFIQLCMNLLHGQAKQYAVITGTTFDLHLSRVVPHRFLQPNHTACYGNYYGDNFARDLIAVRMTDELGILKAALLTLLERVKMLLAPRSVGGSDYSCDGHLEL